MRSSQTPGDHAPLRFDHREGRLRVTLGDLHIDGGPVRERTATDLVAGLMAVLKMRDWPSGRLQLPLGSDGRRALDVRHVANGLEVRALDSGERSIGRPISVPLLAFTDAIVAYVDACPPGDPPTWAHGTADALARWARALSAPGGSVEMETIEPTTPRARPVPVHRTDEPRDLLPVGRLHHLAYRRAWRHRADTLIQVAALRDALGLFDVSGLTMLDRASGAVRWNHPDIAPVGGPCPTRLAVDLRGAPVHLDPTGEVIWRALPPTASGYEALHPIGDRVVAIGMSGVVCALDAATGDRCWASTSYFGEWTGVEVVPGHVWLTAEDGFIQGIDSADGLVRFAIAPGGDMDHGPRLTRHGLLQVLSRGPTWHGALICLDPLTGHTRWTADLGGEPMRRPTIMNALALVIVDDGVRLAIEAIDLRNGEIAWRRPLDAGSGELITMRRVMSLLIVKQDDGTTIALEPQSGELRWLVDGDDPELSLSVNTAPVGVRGLLLIPGTRIRAVDPADGRLVHVVDCDELVPHWMHAWPDGDLAVAEDDTVARYLLGGHLARVD